MATRAPRLYSLDVLRGLAALSVVFWHWQHFFFFDGGKSRTGLTSLYPFYGFLGLLYTEGYKSVDLFFCISGFIFFWLYADQLAEKKITPIRFIELRLSRLYPLHFVMLIVVITLQFYYFNRNGSYFVYPNNGLKEFFQHLTMTNVWTNQGEYSFNGPAWSLSVEIFLYALFIIICRFFGTRAWILLAVVILGQFLIEKAYFGAVRGISPFFLGGLMHASYRQIVKSRHLIVWTNCISVCTVAAWVVGVGVALSPLTPADMSSIPLIGAHQGRVNALFRFWPSLVMFPAIVLTLALVETCRGHLGRRLKILGDVSYSAYLIQFPLQLTAVILVDWLGLNREIFYSSVTLISFFAVLISISLLSHRFFEMPMQNYLRGRLKLR